MRKTFRRVLERLRAGAMGYWRGRASANDRPQETLRSERSLVPSRSRSHG